MIDETSPILSKGRRRWQRSRGVVEWDMGGEIESTGLYNPEQGKTMIQGSQQLVGG